MEFDLHKHVMWTENENPTMTLTGTIEGKQFDPATNQVAIYTIKMDDSGAFVTIDPTEIELKDADQVTNPGPTEGAKVELDALKDSDMILKIDETLPMPESELPDVKQALKDFLERSASTDEKPKKEKKSGKSGDSFESRLKEFADNMTTYVAEQTKKINDALAAQDKAAKELSEATTPEALAAAATRVHETADAVKALFDESNNFIAATSKEQSLLGADSTSVEPPLPSPEPPLDTYPPTADNIQDVRTDEPIAPLPELKEVLHGMINRIAARKGFDPEPKNDAKLF